MAQTMRQVYIKAVKAGIFRASDILENDGGFYHEPKEDPAGVLAAAVAIIRHTFLSDACAALALNPGSFLNLRLEVRRLMAAALFLAYKAKSEDQAPLAPEILDYFTDTSELPRFAKVSEMRRHMSQTITEYELKLLQNTPIHTLLDGNIASIVEIEIGKLLRPMDGVKPLITFNAAMAMLSVVSHLLTITTSTSKIDLLADLTFRNGLISTVSGFMVAATSMVLEGNNIIGEVELPSDTRLIFQKEGLVVALRLLEHSKRYATATPTNTTTATTITSTKMPTPLTLLMSSAVHHRAIARIREAVKRAHALTTCLSGVNLLV